MAKDHPAIAGIEASIRSKRAAIGTLESDIAALEQARAILLGDVRAPAGQSAASNSAQIKDAIYEILQAEHPLHRKVILERVQALGLRVGGKNPLHTLGSHLSTDPRCQPTETRGVWTLATEPDTEPELDKPAMKINRTPPC